MPVSQALFLKEKLGAFEVGTKSIPSPGAGEVLIKEIVAGLNSIDWKIQAAGIFITSYPSPLGSDGAGEIEAVGEGVTQFKKGDRVFHQGSLRGGDYATFQQYALAPAEIVYKLPANITYEQAASIPHCIATTVIPLYSPPPIGVGLKAPWDGARGQYAGQSILILGGASSVGQYVIQFARLSGFSPIITTASLRNADLLKSLGATHVIDRNLPAASLTDEISKVIQKPIPLVYDAVGSEDTQQFGYDTLAESGHIIVVRGSVSMKQTPGSTKKALGVVGSVTLPANRAIGRALAQCLPGLLEAGDIVPNAIEVVPGGLNGIVPGLDRLKKNLVSATKLIVRLGETA